MFNNSVVSQIKKLISDFEKAKFELNGHYFKTSNYDVINAGILFNSIIAEQTDNIIIFHPHGSIFLLYAIGILSFAELIRDLTNDDTLLEKNLRVGGRVRLDGCLGIYEGECHLYGRKYLKIRCGGKYNDLIYIRMPENIARLQIYEGFATKLRGHKRKKIESKSIEIISDILNLDTSQLNIVRASRIAVITENKNILDYIKELKVNDCKFMNIFPVVKLINADKYCAIPGTRLEGRQPVIYIVSSFGMLFDFIQHGNYINTLIIDGVSKIRNNYSNINFLKDKKSVENILIFLDHGALNEKRDFEKIGFKSWVWIKKDIIELKKLESSEKMKWNSDNPFNSHYKVLDSLARQKIDLIDVALPEGVTERKINEVAEIANELKSYNKDLNIVRLNELLISIFGFLLYFQHLVYPDDYESRLSDESDFYIVGSQYIFDKIKLKTEELLLRYMRSGCEKYFNKLINALAEIRERFLVNNFKASKLIDFLRKDFRSSIAIVVRKPWQREILSRWLLSNDLNINRNYEERRFVDIIDFKSFQKLTEDVFYDKIIFSGWFGYENRYIFNMGISPHIILLLYPFEKPRVEKFLNMLREDAFNLRDVGRRAELLGINPKDFSPEKAPLRKTDYLEFEDDLTKILEELNQRIVSDIRTSCPSDDKDAVLARHVIFEEDVHAFLTQNYGGKKLNRIKARIEIKNPDDLAIGDEVIFLSDSRRDIFDQLIKISESSPSVRTEVKLSKIWKEAIRKYMIYKGKDAQTFWDELNKKGCKRHLGTIQNWIANENIIGPENETETLKAIAEVTEDSDLRDNLRDVVRSCRKLRALHIRLGRYLAQCIIASIDSRREEKIEGVMRDRIKELTRHVMIVQIRAIGDSYMTIARNKVNCLLEIGD